MWLVFSLNNNPEKICQLIDSPPSKSISSADFGMPANALILIQAQALPSLTTLGRTWKCQYLHRQTKTCRDRFPHGQFDKLVAFSRREAGSWTHSSFRSGSFPRGSRRHWPRHISHAFFFGRSNSWRSNPPSPEPRGVDDWHSRTTWGWVGEPHQDIV